MVVWCSIAHWSWSMKLTYVRPGWGVKARMVCVWVAGKTVWSHCYTRAMSEWFKGKGLMIKHYINSSVYLRHYTVLMLRWPLQHRIIFCVSTVVLFVLSCRWLFHWICPQHLWSSLLLVWLLWFDFIKFLLWLYRITTSSSMYVCIKYLYSAL